MMLIRLTRDVSADCQGLFTATVFACLAVIEGALSRVKTAQVKIPAEMAETPATEKEVSHLMTTTLLVMVVVVMTRVRKGLSAA